MPTLLETQRAFQAALFGPPGAVPDAVPLDPLGLAVYRNTCERTLIKALALSFPIVERLVGGEFFEGMAYAFIERHLPTSACLNDYGADLPMFLQSFGPAASVPYLADVARLEWAVNRALHAEEPDALDLASLAGLDESALAGLSLTPHPSLSLLALRFPADAIWQAVMRRDDAAMAAIDLGSGPVHLLIERGAGDAHDGSSPGVAGDTASAGDVRAAAQMPDAGGVHVRRMREDAWQFTRRLAAGEPLGVALQAGADAAEPLQAVLADHLASGRFISAGFALTTVEESSR